MSWATTRVGVHRLSLRLPYSVFFHSLFFTCHWIPFVFLLYDQRICTHAIAPSLADGEFPVLRLALVPDVVVSEAEHVVRIMKKSHVKFLPCRLELGTSQSNGRERYHLV